METIVGNSLVPCYLFLDVDGVLNDITSNALTVPRVIKSDSKPLFLSEYICPAKIERLRRIIQAHGNVVIVLSSHWRTDNFFRECLADILTYYEMPAWIGVTPEEHDAYSHLFKVRMPRLSQSVPRAVEIKSWLLQNNDPTNYVAIDDRDIMYGTKTNYENLFADVKDHFYQTRMCGLVDEDVDKIVSLMRKWS